MMYVSNTQKINFENKKDLERFYFRAHNFMTEKFKN